MCMKITWEWKRLAADCRTRLTKGLAKDHLIQNRVVEGKYKDRTTDAMVV